MENYADPPFLTDPVGAETGAAMALISDAVRSAVEVPVGVNILRNDYASALGVAAVCGCRFIRLNVLVGAFVCPEGLIEGRPGEVMRMRRQIAPEVLVFADVSVKHAHSLAGITIDEDALDAVERGGADCLVVTGTRTGEPASMDEVRVVKTRLAQAKATVPVLVGSGVSESNARDVLAVCDGVIVGSYIRKGGKAGGEIELARARRLAEIRQKVEG